jgi:hypothetical protein
MPLPPASKLVLTDPERRQLQTISRHRSTPSGIALRVNIVLGAAEGIGNHVLARNLSTSLPTVLLWRRRYESEGVGGVLEDRHRSGRPKKIPAEKEAATKGRSRFGGSPAPAKSFERSTNHKEILETGN